MKSTATVLIVLLLPNSPLTAGESGPIASFPPVGAPWEATAFPVGGTPRAVPLAVPLEGPYTWATWLWLDEFIEPGEEKFSETSPATVGVLLGEANEWQAALAILDRRLRISQRIGDSMSSLDGFTELPLHEWIQVTVVLDGRGGLGLFLNGREESWIQRDFQAGPIRRMVAGGFGNRMLRGDIKSMLLFPTAFPEDEVRRLSSAGDADSLGQFLMEK